MNSTENLEYVGFWPRVGASIIDGILIEIITLPIFLAFYGSSALASDKVAEGPVDFLLTYVFPVVATILFWYWKQATPGKMALSAKIVDARTGGEPTIGQYVIRYIGYFVSVVPLFLGILWVAYDPKKQGWHDKMAGTVVVRPKNRNTSVKFE
jgi:uncharacterized RDD family membrane protein YckC